MKDLREKGVPEGYEQEYGRVCQRCRTPLGLIFNSGALCPNCDKKVCKTCRVSFEKSEDEHSWLCTVCSKIRFVNFHLSGVSCFNLCYESVWCHNLWHLGVCNNCCKKLAVKNIDHRKRKALTAKKEWKLQNQLHLLVKFWNKSLNTF